MQKTYYCIEGKEPGAYLSQHGFRKGDIDLAFKYEMQADAQSHIDRDPWLRRLAAKVVAVQHDPDLSKYETAQQNWNPYGWR